MSDNKCCICFETFRRDVNPPMLCSPCGHDVCKPCIEQWFRSNSSHSCPQCRTYINSYAINRSLMDIIENGNVINDTGNNNDEDDTCLFKIRSSSERTNEIIRDKCDDAYYVIDNSISMRESDGKIFKTNENGIISTSFGVSRWKEAAQKVIKIANYNIRRNMKATYYLLNPNTRYWKEGVDYIYIDPERKEDTKDKLIFLKHTILNHKQIRGNTPLDEITDNLYRELSRNHNLSIGHSINYNIITDGCPNSRYTFENSINRLAKQFPVFLTINLCTEDDNVVGYYNELDKTIGTELSGMDVIDDLKSEAYEIVNAGNSFFTYSDEIHTCRMSGCFSVVADILDEEEMSVYHSNKLVREILDLPEDIPHWTDLDNYIEIVKQNNKQVYDIYSGYKKPLVNINNLWYKIYKYNLKNQLVDCYKKNMNNIMVFSSVVLVLCMMYMIF